MSNKEIAREVVPSLEPWLIVGLSSFAPLAGALMLPVPWSWYLLAMTAGLTIASIGMLMAQERRARQVSR